MTENGRFRGYILKISIHIPLTGYDIVSWYTKKTLSISIHIPLTGNDPVLQVICLLWPISIHIPLTGYDGHQC